MHNYCLTLWAQAPIILDKKHQLSVLIVIDVHRCILQNGVTVTLSEIRSTYWLLRGRQYVRTTLLSCIVCRKLEETGVDFTRPL